LLPSSCIFVIGALRRLAGRLRIHLPDGLAVGLSAENEASFFPPAMFVKALEAKTNCEEAQWKVHYAR
jgi:hypothetical protein